MATRIVITDAYSTLGQAILNGFEHTHFSVLIPKASSLDWCDAEQVCEYLDDNAPEIIINTVGWGEFPSQSDQERLVVAAEVIAGAAKKYPCTVIHLSSFRVFGGENKSSYDEEDRPSPLDSVGRAYWSAERVMQLELERFLCVRLSWLLDVHSDTLFRRILSDLLAGQEAVLNESRTGSPVALASVSKVVASLVNQILCGAENWGVIHYASGDSCSGGELAGSVLNHLCDDHGLFCGKQVVEADVESQDPVLLQERVSGVLTMKRCRDDFGVQAKSWRQGLGALVGQYLEAQKLEN